MGLFGRSNYRTETISGSTNPMFGKSIDDKLDDLIDSMDAQGWQYVEHYEQMGGNGIFGQMKDAFRGSTSYSVTYIVKFRRK